MSAPRTRIETPPAIAPGVADLPDSPAAPIWRGLSAPPLHIGSVVAEQRGAVGPIALEVLVRPDGRALEIGPFALALDEAKALCRFMALAGALLAGDRPRPAAESGRGIAGWDLGLSRNPAGAATPPPWEGETLP